MMLVFLGTGGALTVWLYASNKPADVLPALIGGILACWCGYRLIRQGTPTCVTVGILISAVAMAGLVWATVRTLWPRHPVFSYLRDKDQYFRGCDTLLRRHRDIRAFWS